MHQCGIRGCTVKLPPYLLFCRDHWAEVPIELRREVNATYRRFARQPGDVNRRLAVREVQLRARGSLQPAA